MKRFHIILLLSVVTVPFFGTMASDELHERMYVQTDKRLYLAGEQILMKLFTVDAAQIPLAFSKVGYVELVRDTVAQVQIKVALNGGTGEGRMKLPADLPSGYYRLVAYTQYMRNESPDVFFEKYVGVINTFSPDHFPESQETHTENAASNKKGHALEHVSLELDKTAYSMREHGELLLSGLPQNIHTLSVSIAGKDLIVIPDTEDAFPLVKKSDSHSGHDTGKFLPEYEGHIITGKIVDSKTGKTGDDNDLLTPAVTFPGEGIRFFGGQKSGEGKLRFITSGIYDTDEIATVVYNAQGKWRIDVESPFIARFESKPTPELYVDSTLFDRLLARSVALQVFHYFSNDSIDSQNHEASSFRKNPSLSYLLDDYTRFPTMEEVFTEFIYNTRFRNRNGKQELSVVVNKNNNLSHSNNVVVLLDGVPVSDHSTIYNYDPLKVEKINVHFGPLFMGSIEYDGIIELTTYRRLHEDLNLDKSTQIIPYDGPQSSRKTHTPDYSVEENRQSRKPDVRHTLLWQPDVQTDGRTSIRIPFNTSDLAGEFQATVEGITQDGKIIHATLIFEVKPLSSEKIPFISI